jgi:flagellar basal body rod protein FlgG
MSWKLNNGRDRSHKFGIGHFLKGPTVADGNTGADGTNGTNGTDGIANSNLSIFRHNSSASTTYGTTQNQWITRAFNHSVISSGFRLTTSGEFTSTIAGMYRVQFSCSSIGGGVVLHGLQRMTPYTNYTEFQGNAMSCGINTFGTSVGDGIIHCDVNWTYALRVINSENGEFGLGTTDKNVMATISFKKIVLSCPTKEVIGGSFTTNEALEPLRGCTKINGNLILEDFAGEIDFSVFDCLQEITGNFYITNNTFEKISGFEKLETVGGYFAIYSNAELISISGFNMLKSVVQTFEIDKNNKLITISGFNKLETVGGNFKITNNHLLEEISEFESLRVIVLHLSIYSNFVLKKILGFVKLETVGGNFEIFNNTNLIEVSGFGALLSVGFFKIENNALLTKILGFEKLERVGINQSTGYFNIHANPLLTTIPVFVALKTVGGNFEIFINALLTTIPGFVNLKEVGGRFRINTNAKLTTILGFGNLVSVGEFYIDDNALLQTIPDFVNLVSVGDTFAFYTNALLTTISGFVKLEKIGGGFNIAGNAKLTTISGFVNLEEVGGNVDINNNFKLTTISGFVNLATVGLYFRITNNSSSVTAENDIVLTIDAFGNFTTTTPKGISGYLTVEGVSINKLISISATIKNNMINGTTGNSDFIHVHLT